jgi:IclR family KDG regulon transcriptional repressor
VNVTAAKPARGARAANEAARAGDAAERAANAAAKRAGAERAARRTRRPESGAPAQDDRRHHAMDGSIAAVRHAARLLAAFAPADRELGVTELARRLGLAKSTVHRLLTTLTREGLVERGTDRGHYRLGLRLYELGSRVPSRADLHLVAVGAVDELLSRTGESVHIAVLDGLDIVVVERRETLATLQLANRLGCRHAAHATSAGKVLLAYLPLAERSALLDGQALVAATPYTITDRARLEEELAKVRSRGWAESAREHQIGLASLAAPIRDARGRVVAAVGIAGPAAQFSREVVHRFALETVRAAGAISAALGYRPTEAALRPAREDDAANGRRTAT